MNRLAWTSLRMTCEVAMWIGFTTSGGSKNVVAALRQAKVQGLATAVLCGEKRGASL